MSATRSIQFIGGYPPTTMVLRFCPSDPFEHWRVEGPTCPDCRARISVVTYKPIAAPSSTQHTQPEEGT